MILNYKDYSCALAARPAELRAGLVITIFLVLFVSRQKVQQTLLDKQKKEKNNNDVAKTLYKRETKIKTY